MQEPAVFQGSSQQPKKQWQIPKFLLLKDKPEALTKASEYLGKQTSNQKRSSMCRICLRARDFAILQVPETGRLERKVCDLCSPQC